MKLRFNLTFSVNPTITKILLLFFKLQLFKISTKLLSRKIIFFVLVNIFEQSKDFSLEKSIKLIWEFLFWPSLKVKKPFFIPSRKDFWKAVLSSKKIMSMFEFNRDELRTRSLLLNSSISPSFFEYSLLDKVQQVRMKTKTT